MRKEKERGRECVIERGEEFHNNSQHQLVKNFGSAVLLEHTKKGERRI